MKKTIVLRNGKQRTMSRQYADLYVRSGRATYFTRDIVAAPVVQDFTPQEDDDIDSAGDVFDAEIHAPSKIKNADGTWRKRPKKADKE